MNIPDFQPATVVSFREHDRTRLKMRGVVKLQDGRELPFAYAAWVEPWPEPDTRTESPYEGLNVRGGFYLPHTQFDWPFAGAKIIVHLLDDQVHFWSWPHLFEEVAA